MIQPESYIYDCKNTYYFEVEGDINQLKQIEQLDYFIKSLFVCQALFYFLNSVLSSLSCDSLFILSKCFSFVKNFFHNFFNQLISKQYL